MDDEVQAAINLLVSKGVFLVRNGSAEIFFDDIGCIQKIMYRLRRRKRKDEDLLILPVSSGKALGHYGKDNELLLIEYETEWTRSRDPDYAQA